MISFFSSTEFYVIASVAAAAVVALCMKPAQRGEAIELLLAGNLCYLPGSPSSPQIAFSSTDEHPDKLLITRSGLSGLTTRGAVSIAFTRIGYDINIEERITLSPEGEPVNTALFTIESLPPGRYHIRYNSGSTGLFTAFTYSHTPGHPALIRPLSR